MGQNKEHKECVQKTINHLKSTHLCNKEHPIFREGNIHFLDVVGFPHDAKSNLKPFAVECECGSSRLQQESNKKDLEEFKKRYPESKVFQVKSFREIDFNKLRE